LNSDFTTISQILSLYWDNVSCETFWSLPWRSRSQHDFAGKSSPAHNFVIWIRILQLFYKNDHQIEAAWRAQHLGYFNAFNFVFDITLTLKEEYIPLSKTYSGSIIRFKRLLFSYVILYKLSNRLCSTHHLIIFNISAPQKNNFFILVQKNKSDTTYWIDTKELRLIWPEEGQTCALDIPVTSYIK
jgi:hypothetical protein